MTDVADDHGATRSDRVDGIEYDGSKISGIRKTLGDGVQKNAVRCCAGCRNDVPHELSSQFVRGG